MKILLIAPTALDYHGNPIKQRFLHLPCLTLPLLAALTPKEHTVRIVFETVEEIPFEEHWDVVGLTGMGAGIVRAWQIADHFRANGCKVVIGGIAVSIANQEWSQPHADAIIIGEADELWPTVINDIANNTLKSVYTMTQRPDINTLPLPRYDLFNRNKIGTWIPVQATRGCPFSCTFCSVTSFFNGTYRKRDVSRVISDIKAARTAGSRRIAFIDDNIGADPDYFSLLCEALIPEKITWMSQCGLHIADHPELLTLAYRSGCRLLSFGIESINSQSLFLVNKHRNRPDHYTEAITTIRKHHIDVSTEMILGFDGDDMTVFQKTYDFLMKNHISVPRIHILTPIPGTALYQKMVQENRIISNDFNHYTGGRIVFRPLNISPEQIQEYYWHLYKKLFSITSLWKRLFLNRASLDIFMRIFVIGVNLHYRRHIKKGICPGIV